MLYSKDYGVLFYPKTAPEGAGDGVEFGKTVSHLLATGGAVDRSMGG